MGVGRFFCVALPFALTIGSIIFLLVGALAGVTDKSLHVFRINLTNMSIDAASVASIADSLSTRAESKTDNITASDLGLGNLYDVNLWGYCYTDDDGDRHCTKAKYNWAAKVLNTTYIEDFGSAAGVTITLPDEIKDSLKAFKAVSRWTEIVFIAALVALAVELFLGIFANCSRAFSCITFIFGGIAGVLVCAAAALATAMASVVVGAVESTAKLYGVKGSIDTKFLSIVWIAAAFALASGFFWLFTICCCKADKRSRDNKRGSVDGEKLLPTGGYVSGGYAPLGHEHDMTAAGGGYYNHDQAQTQYGAPRYPSGVARSDLAYEPYSHRA